MRQPDRRRVLAWACLGIVAGCGPSNGLDLGRVRGTVTFKGAPLTGGDLLFTPDESKGTSGPAAMGSFDEDGEFELSTESAGDGAIVGFHRVGITGLAEEPSKSQADAKPAVPKAKKKRKTPKTPAEIVRGRLAYKLLTPEKLTNPATSGIRVEVKPGSNRVTIDIMEDGSFRIGP